MNYGVVYNIITKSMNNTIKDTTMHANLFKLLSEHKELQQDIASLEGKKKGNNDYRMGHGPCLLFFYNI